LPFELDLAHLTAQHGDPCASYGSHHGGHLTQDHQVAHHQSLPPNTGYQANFHDQLSTGHSGPILSSANDQYGQPTFTHIHDPILQHQPVTNQYEVKRENPKQILATTAVGNDVNPFLRRRPKSVQVTVKRRDSLRRTGDDDQDGRKGWIPIPYPIYKK
jgi:hypothetical protein